MSLPLDDAERAGLVLRALRCPDCGQAVTVAADWSPWPWTGLPVSRYVDVIAAFEVHRREHPSCITVVERAHTSGIPGG